MEKRIKTAMDIVSSYLSNLMLIVGSLFLLIGAIGLIRMPDVFTRMHAASIMETAGASLIIIMLAIFYISSVATHALARACIHDNLKPNAINKESDQ